MTEVTTNQDRKAFRDDLMARVGDLARMCRWVTTTLDFPVPASDPFAPLTWTHIAVDDAEFSRLAAVLGRGVPVELEENVDHRVCRRRFGSVTVELWQSLGERSR